MTAPPSARRFAAFFVLLVGTCLAPLAGAQATDYKVGFVNIPRVLQQAPQAKDARDRIDREFEQERNALVSLQRKIREIEDFLFANEAVMAASELSQKKSDLQSLVNDYRRTQDAFREDVTVRRNEELSKLQRLVLDVIQELARAEEYDLVVSEGVAFASERVDITDQVISKLQATFKPGG